MRLGKGVLVVVLSSTFVGACGDSSSRQPSTSLGLEAIHSLSYSNTESRFEEFQLENEPGTTIRSFNRDFQTVRRMERWTQDRSPLAVSPTEDLVERAQKAAHDLNPETQMQLLHLRRGDRFWYATFQQIYRGREIVGARFILRLTQNGDWVSTQSRLVSPALLKNIPSDTSEFINLEKYYGKPLQKIHERSVILPRRLNDTLTLHAAREFFVFDANRKAPFTLWIDEHDHEILTVLDSVNKMRHITVEANVSPNSPSDEIISSPLAFATILSGTRTLGLTNEYGNYTVPSIPDQNLQVSLENPSLKVFRQGSPFRPSTIGEGFVINISEQITPEESNTFYWLNQAIVYHAKALNFKLPYQLRAYTNYNGVEPSCMVNEGIWMNKAINSKYCTPNSTYADNAFYMSGINILALGTGGAMLKNTALSRDIILHEYGHAVTQEIYGSIRNYEFNAMNEAFSDYLATTMTDDPQLGDGTMQKAFGRNYLRNVDNQMHFAKDFSGQSFHSDSQLFSAALWNLRKVIGAKLADTMIHEARLSQAASIREFMLELLALDEDRDDQNPFTPSRYRNAIMGAFYNRGLDSSMRFVGQ